MLKSLGGDVQCWCALHIGNPIFRVGLDNSVSCSEFSIGGGAICVPRQLCLKDHSDASVLRRTSLCVSRRSGPFGWHSSLPSGGVGFFVYLAAVLRFLRSSLPEVAEVV